ncbi:hypothetical protein SDC9_119922 [bioreactor metagenome]|uniref:Uncharacterized protein n=1 Tax=bioreactor metagenome TaxID=1076179 RepID=A0A645C569_9ZZZZ
MGDDGNFGNRLGALLLGGHQGVSHLVVGDDTLFLLSENGVFLLSAGNDNLKRNEKIALVHGAPPQADSPQGRFVYKVCKIRAYAAGGGLGDTA